MEGAGPGQPGQEMTANWLASRPVPRSWSVVDALWVWLAGHVVAAAFLAVGMLWDDDEWLLVLGVAGHYIGSLGLLWLLSRRREGELGFSVQPRDLLYLGPGLFAQILLALMILPLAELLLPDGRHPLDIVELLAEARTPRVVISLLLAAVVLAPLTEELIFRGVMLQALLRRGRTVAVVVSAAIFSLIHVVGLDTERLVASAAVVLPPFFILGLFLGWVTLRTGRLGPAIFVHSGYNLLAAVVLLIPQEALERALALPGL